MSGCKVADGHGTMLVRLDEHQLYFLWQSNCSLCKEKLERFLTKYPWLEILCSKTCFYERKFDSSAFKTSEKGSFFLNCLF